MDVSFTKTMDFSGFPWRAEETFTGCFFPCSPGHGYAKIEVSKFRIVLGWDGYNPRVVIFLYGINGGGNVYSKNWGELTHWGQSMSTFITLVI